MNGHIYDDKGDCIGVIQDLDVVEDMCIARRGVFYGNMPRYRQPLKIYLSHEDIKVVYDGSMSGSFTIKDDLLIAQGVRFKKRCYCDCLVELTPEHRRSCLVYLTRST